MLEVANEYVHAQNQYYYYSHNLDIKIFEKSTLHGSLESVYNSPMGVHNGDGLYALMPTSLNSLQHDCIVSYIGTCCWVVLLAATCADAMARACCRREEVAWRLATVMAALLGRIGGGPCRQFIMCVDEKVNEYLCPMQHCTCGLGKVFL